MQAWHRQLTQLTEGPYDGYGGKRLLAAELGVFESTIYKWLCASVQPSTRHAQAIKALWQREVSPEGLCVSCGLAAVDLASGC